MSVDIQELAFDALHFRKDNSYGGCLIANVAAGELQQCNAEAIPIVEAIIREHVVPAMEKYREEYGIPDWNSMFRDGPPFKGLSGFLGAYWVICARVEPTRAVAFMKEMTRPVVNEAISRLPLYFNPERPLSDVELPAEYIEYINELSESDVDEFKAVALHVIEKLGLNESAQN